METMARESGFPGPASTGAASAGATRRPEAIVYAALRRMLERGYTRQGAVRAALDAGLHWDLIHRALCRLEREGRCERRRVLPDRVLARRIAEGGAEA